jgi:hypothetical protein
MSLLYRRYKARFGSRPTADTVRERVRSMKALGQGHRMTGPLGSETVLHLVCRIALPAGTDIAKLVGPLPPSPLREVREVAVRGIDEGQPSKSLRVGQHRGIGEDPEKIDEPLLRLMERLRSQGQFDVIKAVRLAYRGE